MLCPPPSYGCSCAKTCDCPVCHYIVGCIFTPKSTGIHIGNTYADISFYKSHNFYNFMLNTNKIDISNLVKLDVPQQICWKIQSWYMIAKVVFMYIKKKHQTSTIDNKQSKVSNKI